jgi:DNA-binding SARP family transcriptional activator
MDFRILGPIEVTHEAEPLAFAPRQRIVLSMLLMEPNRVVAVERLVDALWDDAPPSTAKEQIQICVSSIRRTLVTGGLPNTIVTRAPGYLIQCAEENLDLLAFDRLVIAARQDVAAHRHAEAVEEFRQALVLWRGKPLAGVNSRLVETIGVGLAERRLAVVEEYVAARLRLGDLRELVGELVELVADNPFRERLRAQLMLALHRAGRRAEALETYREGRTLLVEKLGLEPGEELVRAEQAILCGDAETGLGTAPAAEPVVPRLLPADTGDFVGRSESVERVRWALLGPRGRSRSVRTVAIFGRPWLGKTSLAVHVAHTMAEDFPGGQLFVRLGGGRGRAPGTSEVLGRFLGALGIRDLPDGAEARAELYRNRLGDRRMLVVLDDAASERQVLPLLPGNPDCAVIVTSRARLSDLPGATLVGLGPMSPPNATELLARVLGADRARAEAPDLARLADLCAGEPLALRLAATRLAARPHWPIARLVARLSDDDRRLPELSRGGLDLLAAMSALYDRLSDAARLLLRRVSPLGEAGFAGWVCAPMLDLGEEDADDALAELVNAGLLDVERSAEGEVRFYLRGLLGTFARGLDRSAENPSYVGNGMLSRRRFAVAGAPGNQMSSGPSASVV